MYNFEQPSIIITDPPTTIHLPPPMPRETDQSETVLSLQLLAQHSTRKAHHHQ